MTKVIKRVLHDVEGKTFQTWDELLAGCGLDFSAELRPLRYPTPKEPGARKELGLPPPLQLPDGSFLADQPYASAIVRTDTEDCLGIGSTIYGIVQYREWLSVAEELWAQGIKVIYAGAPNLGERAHMVLEVPDAMVTLGEGDEIFNRLVVTASHDCSSKLTLQLIPFRPSNNTYLTFDTPIFSEKHSKHVRDRVTKAKQVMEKMEETWNGFEQNVKKMTLIKLSDEEARRFVEHIIGKGDSPRTVNARDKVFDLWKHTGVGRSVPACHGTLFGLVQAFVEYADHHSTVRRSKFMDAETAEFHAKMFGSQATRKAKVWAVSLHMARQKDHL